MMALIITTSGIKIATHEERCARCRKIIQIGEQYQDAQVHYSPPRFDYRFGAVHYPDCGPLTTTNKEE